MYQKAACSLGVRNLPLGVSTCLLIMRSALVSAFDDSIEAYNGANEAGGDGLGNACDGD